MIGFYNYTVILTYIGLISAVTGIFIGVTPERIINGVDNSLWSVLCLMISGLCDMFDGKVARTMERTKQQKQFGIQIDSLADLICFGVLPAVIGYSIGLNKWYYIILLVWFVLSALIRLAYFNVMEEERQNITTENRKTYEGLPVTNTALIIPFIYIFKYHIGEYFHLVYGVVLFVISWAFLIKFKVRKVGMRTMLAFVGVGIIEVIFIWLGVRR